MAGLELELRGAVGEIPREQWNALVAGESPFLEWEWLASLEEAGCVGEQTGWAPRPLLLREAGGTDCRLPAVFEGAQRGRVCLRLGLGDAAQRAGIAYYPKLWWGWPFTPVSGALLPHRAGRKSRARAARPSAGRSAAKIVQRARAFRRACELLPAG